MAYHKYEYKEDINTDILFESLKNFNVAAVSKVKDMGILIIFFNDALETDMNKSKGVCIGKEYKLKYLDKGDELVGTRYKPNLTNGNKVE